MLRYKQIEKGTYCLVTALISFEVLSLQIFTTMRHSLPAYCRYWLILHVLTKNRKNISLGGSIQILNTSDQRVQQQCTALLVLLCICVSQRVASSIEARAF